MLLWYISKIHINIIIYDHNPQLQFTIKITTVHN